VLYGTADVGRPKAEAAALRLRSLNPYVRVEPAVERIEATNALRWVERFDVVLDGTDNLETRYALSDACVIAGRPYVHGSVYRFEGHAAVFSPPEGPCYRCPFPSPPGPGEAPDCAEGGVLGVLPGLVGTIQATEAIKIVLGLEPTLRGRLLVVDALSMSFREFALRRRADCAACGDDADLRAPIAASPPACAAPADGEDREWTPDRAADRIRRGEDVCLLDVRTALEWEIARLEGAVHIPMDQIASRLDELDRDRRTVVLCHHGARSAMVADFLRRQGFRSVVNLAGGIDAWARTVDPSVPRY
jgi:adenylyltransferase/sulfurtransferase